MSLSYPEGECFFKRSALRSATYDADKPEHFYGHLLVEYLWNRPAFQGPDSYYSREVHYHPRSPYRVVKGDLWSAVYGNWTSISFLYGTKPHSDRYRQVEHNLCVSGNGFRDQEKGGALESRFMVIPMTLLAKGEEWLLIDRTACIRGIYIPVAQQASEDYPEVCTFLQVNFAINREVSILTHPEIWDPDRRDWGVVDRLETLRLDATFGLAPDAEWTMAINIRQLVNLLSLPRPLRAHNCFSSHSIRLVDRKLTPTKGPAQMFSDATDLNWTTVAGANYGLAIQWKPPEATTWLADFLKNTLTVAVGFIPVVGPLAAVAFPLTWTAIVDPERFEGILKQLIPVADLAMKVADDIRRSAKEEEAYLIKGWIIPGAKGLGDAPKLAPTATPTGPAEPPSAATVKQFQSIRKFKYWNVLKSAATPSTVKEAAEPDTQSAKQAPLGKLEDDKVPIQPPGKVVLEEVEPAASFRLAGQILLHAGESSVPAGTDDDSVGETLQEVLPDNLSAANEDFDNNYDWMEEYLYDLLTVPDAEPEAVK